MTLQARLTLYYVLLAVLMAGGISGVNLINETQAEFDATLERAKALRELAVAQLKQAVNRQPTTPLREALQDPDLVSLFKNTMLASHYAILEIAVVDPTHDNEILLDSSPDRVAAKLSPYEDFESLVTATTWYQKLRALYDNRYYQLQSLPLQAPPSTNLSVRVVIDPAMIELKDIGPVLKKQARVTLFAAISAVALTFLVSTFAFRPLAKLRRQLDLLSRGEFEPETPSAKPATDELSVMASKVSLLGQRLRGAQYEVSDLRGNIDRLMQDLEDAVFIFNREQRLVFASGTVEKFVGRTRSELPGQMIASIFPPETPLGLIIEHATETGHPIRNRRVPVDPAAGLPATVPVVLLSVDLLETLPGAARSGILVRLRDPEAQRKIGRELQTADRLSAISRVSGGVAHEVKNPLNAILLHVEVAKAKLARGDTAVEQQMEIIGREIVRLDRVVKTFLDFTRPVELRLNTISLQGLMNEIVELARPQADAQHIDVKVVAHADSADVRVDTDLIKQAVLNVVMNAMQAMPEGGELRFTSSVSGDLAEVHISDTGPGIPPELRDKIFKLYFTTRKEGSGIGLAMTFRIVQLHDGTIDFTSEPGKGTTFFIRLPIAV